MPWYKIYLGDSIKYIIPKIKLPKDGKAEKINNPYSLPSEKSFFRNIIAAKQISNSPIPNGKDNIATAFPLTSFGVISAK